MGLVKDLGHFIRGKPQTADRQSVKPTKSQHQRGGSDRRQLRFLLLHDYGQQASKRAFSPPPLQHILFLMQVLAATHNS